MFRANKKVNGHEPDLETQQSRAHPVLVHDINDHTESTLIGSSVDQSNPPNFYETRINLQDRTR